MQFYHTGDLINMIEISSVFLAILCSEKSYIAFGQAARIFLCGLISTQNPEIEFLNFYGAQEPIPRNQFRQPL